MSYRWLFPIVLSLVVAAGCGGAEGPAQPIDFSHRLHAGDYQVPCLYCHDSARRSPVAGVPPVQRCMNCHRFVAISSPEIQKIIASWDKKEPIRWIRVHTLPDFVYFSHKRHVLKDIACQSCHGEVERMDRVRRVASLEMGWCLACHEKNGASRDCLTCHK